MSRTKHCVLLAVCGMSPAVITETVQAIYEKYDDYVIDEVVVLTTTEGKERLVAQLLAGGAWEQLKTELGAGAGELRFGNSGRSIQLLANSAGTSDLADIDTTEDHLAMANQLCDLLRAKADNPNVTILASLAGGRKTMSTMMGLCFSLFARDGDKLFHVLVNPPFDEQMEPLFLFKPKTPVFCKRRNGETISTAQARIELIEIPCVRLRKLFPKYLGQHPGSYSDLVSQANSALTQHENEPLAFDLFEAECRIGGVCVINGRRASLQFLLYYALAKARKENVTLKEMQCLADYVEDVQEGLMSNPNVEQALKRNYNIARGNVSKALHDLKVPFAGEFKLYGVVQDKEHGYYLDIDPKLITLP